MSTDNVNVIKEVEQALADEQASLERRSQERLTAATRERDKISRVSSLLRFIGVAVLAAAMGTLMFQRWGEMSQMSRYFTFLAFTAGVCASGLLCGLKIGESKGARTLLGAVVALIPFHAAQIGAFLYSRLGHGVNEIDYPSYFFLSVPSLTDALIVAVGGVVALVPMAYMAYSVLARNYAGRLLALGCGVSAALLVPTRDPLLVAGLLSIAGGLAYMGERKISSIVELKTREAVVARLVPFIALAMIIGRQCSLYHPTSVFSGAVLALVSVALFGILPRLVTHKAVVWGAEVCALYTTAFSAIFIGHGLSTGFNLSSILSPLIVGLPLTVVYTVMAPKAKETPGFYRFSAAVALFLTGLGEFVSGNGVDGALISLVLGILGITYACVNEQKLTLFAGGALALLSLYRVVVLTITSISVSPWLILGIIGVTTILGASYLERNFVKIREAVSLMRRHVADWN